jgi:esterase/lipase
MKDNISQIGLFAGGLFTTIIAYLEGKRRNNAEVDKLAISNIKVATDEFKDLIELIKQDSNEQRAHRNKCEKDIAELRDEIEKIKRVCKSDCFNFEK